MKLIISILHNDDSARVISELSKSGFTVTKLKTTGGFLRAGNCTLLCGVEEKDVQSVIDIIKEHSQTRKELVFSSVSITDTELYSTPPIEIEVGGATIFVVDVERFEKV